MMKGNTSFTFPAWLTLSFHSLAEMPSWGDKTAFYLTVRQLFLPSSTPVEPTQFSCVPTERPQQLNHSTTFTNYIQHTEDSCPVTATSPKASSSPMAHSSSAKHGWTPLRRQPTSPHLYSFSLSMSSSKPALPLLPNPQEQNHLAGNQLLRSTWNLGNCI